MIKEAIKKMEEHFSITFKQGNNFINEYLLRTETKNLEDFLDENFQKCNFLALQFHESPDVNDISE